MDYAHGTNPSTALARRSGTLQGSRMVLDTMRQHLRQPGRSALRRGAALLGTLVYSIRRQRLQRFSVDGDGLWINRSATGTLVSPEMNTADLRQSARVVLANWCDDYMPRAGDVVVDVGAGVGEEVLVFSKLVGPTGRVIAIEAHPRTFACLQRTVERSGLPNVTPLWCAVSDASGHVGIQDSIDHIANSIVADGDLDVPAETLDGITERVGIDRIDFLKMNIEGAERHAMRGMSRSLEMIRHAVISCHDFVSDQGGDSQLRTKAEIVAGLEARGFTTRSRPTATDPWVRDNVYARPSAARPR
jgi:FkbM family methyltransferase